MEEGSNTEIAVRPPVADLRVRADKAIPLRFTRRQCRLLVAGLVCLMENLLDWRTIQDLYEAEGVADPQDERHIPGRDKLMAEANSLKMMLRQADKLFK